MYILKIGYQPVSISLHQQITLVLDMLWNIICYRQREWKIIGRMIVWEPDCPDNEAGARIGVLSSWVQNPVGQYSIAHLIWPQSNRQSHITHRSNYICPKIKSHLAIAIVLARSGFGHNFTLTSLLVIRPRAPQNCLMTASCQ